MPHATAAQAATFTMYASATGKGHLDLACTGLDRMREAGREPADHLTPYRAKSPSLLFGGADFSPCRLCAIEEVALDILTASDPGGEVGFAITALGAARPTNRRPSTSFEDEQRRNEIRAAASERIARIATATGLAWTATPRGAVLFGNVPAPTLHRLSRHFAVTVLPAACGDHRPEVIATFWALQGNEDLAPDEAWQAALDIHA